jgi:hypothetical protein
LTIVSSPSSGYTYHGCYNETTGLPDTAGVRALGGGTNLVRAGNMTVEMCWEFCRTGAGDSSGGKTGRFSFAGVEYARYVSFFLPYVLSSFRGLVEVGIEVGDAGG